MQTSTNLTRWRKWFYRGFGALLMVLFYIFLWLNDKSKFVTLLIIGLSSSIIGLFVNKRVKRRHNILGKEKTTPC